MSHRVFFFNRVAEGVSESDAEAFLRSEDLPMARTLSSFSAYTLTHLEGTIEEPRTLPCEFIDVADVTSIDDYRAEISALDGTPNWSEFVAKFDHYFSEAIAIYGSRVE